jgi:hypothetical protein
MDMTEYVGSPDKWLRLLVSGHNVPRAMGEEIILATFQPENFHVNDAWFERQVAGALDMEVDTYGWISYESAKRYRAAVGGLELNWMGNHQIGSSWIGGPHGWVDWDGKVGCGSYNLGKYPSNEEITEDLTLIAARWPGLKLWVQVLDHEGDGPVSGEWKVDGGEVERFDKLNYNHVTPPIELDPVDTAMNLIYKQDRERGISIDLLKAIYDRVRTSR